YSDDAVNLINQTLEGVNYKDRVSVHRDSVLNEDIYSQNFDLAIACDLIEHLSSEELDQLYQLVSSHLTEEKGVFLIHTAPNLWNYLYEHPRQQRLAKQAGFWQPRIRRSWFEKIMHINEQNPRILKKQLKKSFPYVYLWFGDHNNSSLLQEFSIADLRQSTSIFALASHHPVDIVELSKSISMAVLTDEETDLIKQHVLTEDIPEVVPVGATFQIDTLLNNFTSHTLTSRNPYPFHLSYHWLDETGDFYVRDGERSQLSIPVAAGSQKNCHVRVVAPETPGTYQLHVAPVQEAVRWFDKACSSRITIKVIAP
ncbi:MAG: hypothetical protein HKP55_06630, partial [Gammaproteobacteria bacterium]|nr:hypothetical protein [Gammaproteobacteria bacterium]